MKPKVNKTIRTVKSTHEFFKEWLRILRGFSNLTLQEEEFLSLILTKRHELSRVILDRELLTRNLFDSSIKKEIVAQLELTNMQRFETLMNQLRKKKVILDSNEISPSYIPQTNDIKEFIIAFVIKFDGDGEG